MGGEGCVWCDVWPQDLSLDPRSQLMSRIKQRGTSERRAVGRFVGEGRGFPSRMP